MSDLQVRFDWLDISGKQAPEIRHTMADVEIIIGDTPVTRVLDKRSRTTRDRITVSLYPLAEWIVGCWWSLLEENKAAHRGTEDDYAPRHSLVQAGDGFAMPDLTIVPEGPVVALQYRARQLRHQPLEFLTAGEAHIARPQLEERLADVVQSVIGRLQDLDVGETWLEQEWQRIRNLDDDERDFCRAAGSVGVDPFALSEADADAIQNVGDALSPSLAEGVFRCVPVEYLRPAADWVLKGAAAADGKTVPSGRLAACRDALGLGPEAPPWDEGYDLARRLRRHLDLRPNAKVSFSDVFGTDVDVVNAPPPPVRSLDGIVAGLGSDAFACFGSRRCKPLRRFLLARALGVFLEGGNGRHALLSAAVTEDQKRNRAFAAEFLAPAEGIRERLTSETISADDIDDLSHAFDVAPMTIQHQIQNHRLATILDD